MSILSRAILILALLIGGRLYAGTVTPQIGGGISQFDGGISNLGKVAAQPTGDILLVDGVSLLLQTDGASFVCLAGGC